jgi:hypothetical protein
MRAINLIRVFILHLFQFATDMSHVALCNGNSALVLGLEYTRVVLMCMCLCVHICGCTQGRMMR